jgi:Holliday junction resolvase-like predicted endonuclease
MYTALQLDNRRVCVNPAENFERSVKIKAVEPLEVHRVWSILAEEGVGLVCQLLCELGMCGHIDTVVGLVEDSCRRMLSEGGDKVVLELQTRAVSGDIASRRSRISEVVSKFVKSAAESTNLPVEIRSAVIKYYVDPVEAFGRLPKESATAEVLRKYINVALCTRSFLEYEVYSHLISVGIPAVPRLRVDYGKEGSKEIDLIAAIGDRIYVVEVTTERDLNLEEELRSLCDVSQILNADGVLLISTNENCKKVAELRYCNVRCLSFEGLCASPQKLLETLIDKSRN